MNFLTRKVKSRLWNPNSIDKVEKHIKNYSSSGELKSYVWNWLSNLICEESWFWVELKLTYTYHPHSHLPAPWLRTSECRLPFCFFFTNSDTNKNCASFVLLSENLDRTSIHDERPFAQASIRLWRWYIAQVRLCFVTEYIHVPKFSAVTELQRSTILRISSPVCGCHVNWSPICVP